MMKNITTNRKRVVLKDNRARIWGGRFHIDICFTSCPENLNSVADVLEEGLDLVYSAGEDTGNLGKAQKILR